MQITENETVYLVTISKGRIVNLNFGASRASLNVGCKWAIDAIRERRKAQECGSVDLASVLL